MWVVPQEEKKRALRNATLARRHSLSQSEWLWWSRLIQAQALQLPAYLASRTVALYSPVQNEVSTDALLAHAIAEGRKVFYPRLEPGFCLVLVQIDSVADLRPGHFGILEPKGVAVLSDTYGEGLIVFVPGVAFDTHGRRLGRGKGWYDRLLKRLGGNAVFIGLGYEFQIVEEVPAEPWDQNVHYIVTEERVIDCTEISAQSKRVL
jgi:5-formyltetrahydrofolate cyclo-ligase